MPCRALSNNKFSFSGILTFIFEHIFRIDAILLFESETVWDHYLSQISNLHNSSLHRTCCILLARVLDLSDSQVHEIMTKEFSTTNV